MKHVKVYVKGKFGSRVLVSAEVLEEHTATLLVRLPGGDVVTRHKRKHLPEEMRKALEAEERARI